MEKYRLECLKCGNKIGIEREEFQNCPKCGGSLTVKMSIDYLNENVSKSDFFNNRILSMWSFFEFLPLLKRKNIVSLMEGNIPILRSNRLAKQYNLNHLYLKLEYLNPTSSFKDRQISMGVSKAIEFGKNSVITMSSGNVGAAVAAYSARAGLKNIILIPSIAPEGKITQIKMYGGNVVKIKSDSTEFISKIVKDASQKFNMANLITAAIYNPFIINGAKTIAYEIAIQCKVNDSKLPDIILIPVGGSGLLSGIFEGFEELYQLDFIDFLPRLIAIQPEGCAPFVNAIHEDLKPDYLFENPWENINTISTALADDIPLDCHTGIPAVKKSKGFAISVSDEETLEAEKELGRFEGIFAEPSSCVTIAALKKLEQEGPITNNDVIYCLITGSGFKDVPVIQGSLPISEVKEKDFDWESEFREILKTPN
ncbi:MAG: threonine synthase [Candidatus Lokiarchaeota archaeon]|nr:threonine synthase [Candidatus Lokiarchaeota archaeon]MBD3342287.1 threonine synthase [Candidatus Lokiarchaeota archaeon]